MKLNLLIYLRVTALAVVINLCISYINLLYAQNFSYNEPYRGQLHYSSNRGFLGDPNGLIYYNDEYHLFYQYNPYDNIWGSMHWGHAVSKDLVHWTELDIALYPDEFGHMYSGAAIIDKNNTSGLAVKGKLPMIIFYTAAGAKRTQNMAYSYDGRNFIKYPTPLVQQVVPGNRDPRVLWHQATKKWVMLFYGEKAEHHTVFFYTSTNLKDWTYASEFKAGPKSSKYLFECNDLYELEVDGGKENKKWVLTGANGEYAIGSFDGTSFRPEQEKLQSIIGTGIYAAQTFSEDPLGRRIEILRKTTNTQKVGMPFNQSMSIPMEMKLLTTNEGIRLTRTPVAELEKLRIGTNNYDNAILKNDKDSLTLTGVDLAEISTKFKPGKTGIVSFKIRGEEVIYNANNKQLLVGNIKASVALLNDEIELKIYVDRSGFEIFINGGLQYIPYNKFPATANQSFILKTKGEPVKFTTLKVYKLKSSWIAPVAAQLKYAGPQLYTVNKKINPLTPVKSGGDIIPAVIKGRTTTVAGNRTQGHVNGPKSSAQFFYPNDLAIDKSGNIYVAEDGSKCIRKISSSGEVRLLAGSQNAETGFVDGNGADARFSVLVGIALHPLTGDIYVTDLNSIRKITPQGVVSTFAGSNGPNSKDFKDNVTPAEARFDYLSDIVIDKEGNIYVADRNNQKIRKYTTSTGLFTTLAGSTAGWQDGAAAVAKFNWPTQLALDDIGNVFVTDRKNFRIRKVTPNGTVSTIAGNGTETLIDGKGLAAAFSDPIGIAVAKNGNIYVTDYNKNVIREIDAETNVTTFIGTPEGGFVNAIGTGARIRTPFGITIGADNDLYFVERMGQLVRKASLGSKYSVHPALPTGLHFNDTTGTITGTPTTISPNTTYTINEYNGYGEVTASTKLQLAVGRK